MRCDEEELRRIIAELQTMQLLDADWHERHEADIEAGNGDVVVLGTIDALVSNNEIAAEQAEKFVRRLGISAEEMDRMRSNLRKTLEWRRRQN